MKRLRDFLFLVVRRDGTHESVIFYAGNPRQATQYARAWAQKIGHCRVELQDEERVA